MSPNAIGTDRFSTQTFNESVARDFYFKAAQIYSGELGASDTVVHFLPPNIGRTFAAADVLAG